MKISDTMKATIAGAWAGSISMSLKVYNGTMPASANTAPTGTLLVQIDDQANYSVNNGAATWSSLSGTAVATGTAKYAALDDGAGNRIYFTVGTASAELIISTTSVKTNDVINGSVVITAVP